MRRGVSRLFRKGSIALSVSPLGPLIPEVAATTFVTPDQFQNISTFPPYSPANKDLFMAWLRKGPRKDVSEYEVSTFLFCWEHGKQNEMIFLTPILPRAIVAPEPTGMVPFFDAKDHPRFVLKRMSAVVIDCPRVVGLNLFADTVRCLIDRRMCVRSQTLQSTIALVVKNCSGVGKTVASLAVCSRLNAYPDGEWFFIPLYVGFNSKFTLNANEKRLLESDPGNCEAAVGSIFVRRLFLQLDALVQATEDDVTVEEAMKDSPDSWCPKMPLPEFDVEFRKYGNFPPGEMTTPCVEKIEQLSTRCGGKKLAILMIVDEGQLFDGDTVKIKDGARIALRFARKLQAAVVGETHNAMLIPMMTGINPHTALSQSTDGRNLNVECEILTRLEFFKMVAKLYPGDGADASQTKIEAGIDTTILYPLAREASALIANPAMKLHVELDRKKAPLELIACAAKTFIAGSFWHTHVPAVFRADGRFAPIVPMIAINLYLVSCGFSMLGMELPSTLDGFRKAVAAEEFEGRSFRALIISFALVNCPRGETALEGEKEAYGECQQLLKGRMPWFDVEFPLASFVWGASSFPRTSAIESERDVVAQKDSYLPSSALGAHKSAFEHSNPLHTEIRQFILRNCNKVGGWCAIQTGGSAPVDFIFLFCVRDDAGGPMLRMRLADAKHRSKVTSLSRGELDDMAKKFSFVADYLRHRLPLDCGMSIVQDARPAFAVICNAEPDVVPEGIIVLSPKTFDMPPVTDFLFRTKVAECVARHAPE